MFKRKTFLEEIVIGYLWITILTYKCTQMTKRWSFTKSIKKTWNRNMRLV